MTKEFEALHTIAFNTQINGMNFGNELRTIESALNELKAIKEANTGEALECVDYIEKKLEGLKYECERTNNHRCDDLFIQEHIFTTIKQALIEAQETERLLDHERELNNHLILKTQKQEKEIDRLENQCLDVLGGNIRLKKVLKIIKEKKVRIRELEYSTKVEGYNYFSFENEQLTEEEFTLLKEVLCND